MMAAVMRNVSGSNVEAQLIYAITLPISCAIILINLLIILAITCNRQLHNSQNYFFLSLLVADMCTGVALPFIPWMGLNRPLSFSSCLLVHIFPNFLFLAFLFNLVLVHYERYRSIVSPLQRGQLWLHRRFVLPLLAVWMLPLLFALLPAFGWNNKAIHDRNECCPITNSTARSNCVALSGERCCTYRSVFPNAFIYLEVYGLLAPAILSIAAMTCRVLWHHTRAAEGHPASAASRSKQGMQTENGNALRFLCGGRFPRLPDLLGALHRLHTCRHGVFAPTGRKEQSHRPHCAVLCWHRGHCCRAPAFGTRQQGVHRSSQETVPQTAAPPRTYKRANGH